MTISIPKDTASRRSIEFCADCRSFATPIGTSQGGSLSPVLGATHWVRVYLEATLRDLRSRLSTRPPADATLPLEVEKDSDITDFVSSARSADWVS